MVNTNNNNNNNTSSYSPDNKNECINENNHNDSNINNKLTLIIMIRRMKCINEKNHNDDNIRKKEEASGEVGPGQLGSRQQLPRPAPPAGRLGYFSFRLPALVCSIQGLVFRA